MDAASDTTDLPLTGAGTIFQTVGVVDNGVSLDGIEGFIYKNLYHECLGLPEACFSGLTVSLWFKIDPRVMVLSSTNFTILSALSDGVPPENARGFILSVQTDDARFEVRENGQLTACNFKIAVTFWTHFTFSWSQAVGLTAFQNGAKVCEQHELVTTPATYAAGDYGAVVFSLGWSSLYSSAYLKGEFDELQIFENWFSNDRLQELYGMYITDKKIIFSIVISQSQSCSVHTVFFFTQEPSQENTRSISTTLHSQIRTSIWQRKEFL